jgi:hypothetical protein
MYVDVGASKKDNGKIWSFDCNDASWL